MDGALYKAAIDGSHQDLRGRLTSSNVYEIRSRGQKNTILHVAAKSGKLQLNVEDNGDHLLRCLYEQNNKGNTPLHIAAKLGHVEMATTLVKMARTDVEQNKRLLSMRNNEQDTALHQAVRHNRLQIVKLLIEEYPDSASEINGDGDSPLFMAVDRCFYTVAFYILANATNCSYEGRNGMNALHVAVIRSQTSGSARLLCGLARGYYFTRELPLDCGQARLLLCTAAPLLGRVMVLAAVLLGCRSDRCRFLSLTPRQSVLGTLGIGGHHRYMVWCVGVNCK